MMTDWSWHSIAFGWLLPTGALILAAWLVIVVANRYRNR